MRSPFRFLIFLSLCAQPVLLADAGGQSAPAQSKAQDGFPGKSWLQISSLEKAGWSREKLAPAHEYANSDSIGTSAVVIVQGGDVVEYGIKRFHRAVSLTLLVLACVILGVEFARTGALYSSVSLGATPTVFCGMIQHLFAKFSQSIERSHSSQNASR